jgi:TolB-like protein/DNA-binding winged helix-turn-helix (wHTH) protein
MGNALRIGAWLVDPVRGQLSRDGEIVRLDARALRLLLHLASRPGEVISIDALLDHVWPDVTVSPDSVYQAVTSLRRQLGDDPKHPTYIETVARQGYRLIAPVSDTPPPANIRSIAKRSLLRLSGTAIAATLLALVFLRTSVQAPPPAPQRNTVAVLPFLDLTSAAMREEYVADGVTEELIDRLSRLPHVRVPAPTASFYFKGRHASVTEVANALHVAFVLDGSLRRSGDTLRVAVRLMEGRNGFVLWSGTYDRKAGDILKLQDEIAGDIAKRLRPCFRTQRAA